MKNRLLFAPIFAILTLCYSCGNPQKPSELNLKLIVTTDVHGAVMPYDYTDNKPSKGSLAKLSKFLKQERANPNQTVLLFDNGDFLQGQPFVYYYNYVDTAGIHPSIEAMNFLGYNAANVGNHDIECGHAVYDKLRAQMTFPWLAANAVNMQTNEPYFNPYTIIDVQGVKVAVLGLTTPAIPDWLAPGLWSGMAFDDMIESAKKWVAIIKETEHPDVLVGLFHAGVDYSYNGQTETTYKNENATMLVAKQVPGFDVIFAGHDHREIVDSITNIAGQKVYVVDAGSGAQNAGIAQVWLKADAAGKYQIRIAPSLSDLRSLSPDSVFVEKFGLQHQKVLSFINQPLGRLNQSLSTKEAFFGPNPFLDLIHTVQLQVSLAQISFAAPLSYNTTLPAGEVISGQLFSLYRYENSLYTMNLTGSEIDKVLEFSASQWFNQMKSVNDHLLKLTENTDGKLSLTNKYYNFESASGIDYLVDVSKPDGHKVHILGFSNGQPFSETETYTVALNSYRAMGGGGHLTVGAGIAKPELERRVVNVSKYDIRYYLMEYFKSNAIVNASKPSYWRIIPEDYYEKGKQRDFGLLFGNEN